jgi:hypothetical protein
MWSQNLDVWGWTYQPWSIWCRRGRSRPSPLRFSLLAEVATGTWWPDDRSCRSHYISIRRNSCSRRTKPEGLSNATPSVRAPLSFSCRGIFPISPCLQLAHGVIVGSWAAPKQCSSPDLEQTPALVIVALSPGEPYGRFEGHRPGGELPLRGRRDLSDDRVRGPNHARRATTEGLVGGRRIRAGEDGWRYNTARL